MATLSAPSKSNMQKEHKKFFKLVKKSVGDRAVQKMSNTIEQDLQACNKCHAEKAFIYNNLLASPKKLKDFIKEFKKSSSVKINGLDCEDHYSFKKVGFVLTKGHEKAWLLWQLKEDIKRLEETRGSSEDAKSDWETLRETLTTRWNSPPDNDKSSDKKKLRKKTSKDKSRRKSVDISNFSREADSADSKLTQSLPSKKPTHRLSSSFSHLRRHSFSGTSDDLKDSQSKSSKDPKPSQKMLSKDSSVKGRRKKIKVGSVSSEQQNTQPINVQKLIQTDNGIGYLAGLVDNNKHIAEIEKYLSEPWTEPYRKFLDGCRSARLFFEKLVKDNYTKLAVNASPGSEEWKKKDSTKTEIDARVKQLISYAQSCLHKAEHFIDEDEKFIITNFNNLVTPDGRKHPAVITLNTLDKQLKEFYEKNKSKLESIDNYLKDKNIEDIETEDQKELDNYRRTFGTPNKDGEIIYDTKQYFNPEIRGYLREPYCSGDSKQDKNLKTTNEDALPASVRASLDGKGFTDKTPKNRLAMAKKAEESFASNVKEISLAQSSFMKDAPKIIESAYSIVTKLTNSTDETKGASNKNSESIKDTKNQSWKKGNKSSDCNRVRKSMIGKKSSNQKNSEGSNEEEYKSPDSENFQSSTATTQTSVKNNMNDQNSKQVNQERIDELMEKNKQKRISETELKELYSLLKKKNDLTNSNLTVDEDKVWWDSLMDGDI